MTREFTKEQINQALLEFDSLILEEEVLKDILSERITTDDPRAQAILDKPYTPEGERQLKALGAGPLALDAYKAGTAGQKGLIKNLWDDAGDYWAGVGIIDSPEDIGHLILDIVGMIPVAGVPADLANFIWYASKKKYLYAGLSLFAALPIAGYLANALKASVRGQILAAKMASRAVTHLPTFVRYGDTVARGTKKISAETMTRITKETSDFITRASKSGKEGFKIAEKVTPTPAAVIKHADEAVEQVQRTTAKVFRRESRKASAKAFDKALQKTVGEKGFGGAVVAARAAKEAVEKQMADAGAEAIKLSGYLVKNPSSTRIPGQLARAVFKAGGDYRTLNRILKVSGSPATAKTIVASVKTLEGPAAKEFLELAAKAKAKGITIGGVRVTTSYMKKYNVRQFKRAGILTVKYDVLSHIIGDDTIEDDPLKPIKGGPKGSKGKKTKVRGRGGYRPCATNLKMGCGGKNVEELQTLLNKYYAKAISTGKSRGLRVDGKFGNNTSNTVTNFQKQHKLKADGIAGAETMKKLRELTAGTATTTGEKPPPSEVGADLLSPFDIDTQLAAAGLTPDKDQRSHTRAGLELGRLQYRRNQPLTPEEIKKVAKKYIDNPVKESKQAVNKVLSEHKKKVHEDTFKRLIKSLKT